MRVVVVGGGIAGLAAATRLAEHGHRVELHERRAQLGGRAYSVTDETTGDVIDNGQHLFMGCYRAVRGFLRRIGAAHLLGLQRDLEVTLRDGARTLKLEAAPLPAPLHLAGGLLGFSALTALDRLRLLPLGLALAAPSARFPAATDFETVERWLERYRLSASARRALFRPLALATLNDEPQAASARLLEAVLREAFLGSREDARLGLASCGLSQLYVEPARAHLARHAARVVTSSPVAAVRLEGRTARGVVLADGTRLDADAVILAVPSHAVAGLIPGELHEGETYFAGLRALERSPIVSVHLWLDRAVESDQLLGLTDRPVHWLFPQRADGRRARRFSIVISAARALVERPAGELAGLAFDELRRALPEAQAARLVHARVFKDRDATIAHTAGTEGLRPGVRSPVDGLFLAGDYVRTGLPATLESAVRAAEEAAALAAEHTPPSPRPGASLIPLQRLSRS